MAIFAAFAIRRTGAGRAARQACSAVVW